MIKALDNSLSEAIWNKINLKTKPLGSLGLLEHIAHKVALVQQTLKPTLLNPHLFVIAADHGIALEGVSDFPQEVTYQMVMNFVGEGAAINAFSKQHGIKLQVVDAGVNYSFDNALPIIHGKIGLGTKSFLKEQAISEKELTAAQELSKTLISKYVQSDCNIIGFGEMGIANTSSAAAMMSLVCHIPVNDCVGRGTGINDEKLHHKIRVITEGVERAKPFIKNPADVLLQVGGFEIAVICYAMIEAAKRNRIVLVDGFIATAAFLVAHSIEPNLIDYALFCHQSNEKAHEQMLDYLKQKPILNLGMRLGEGTGCAVAYPIIKSAVHFLNEMASFETAGVSNN